MDAAAIERALRRIAHEIIERNPELARSFWPEFRRAGMTLPSRIAAFISEIEKSRRRHRRH